MRDLNHNLNFYEKFKTFLRPTGTIETFQDISGFWFFLTQQDQVITYEAAYKLRINIKSERNLMENLATSVCLFVNIIVLYIL